MKVTMEYARELARTSQMFQAMQEEYSVIQTVDEMIDLALLFMEKYPLDTNWAVMDWEEELEKFFNQRNKEITIFIDGRWELPESKLAPIKIFDVGTVIKTKDSHYNTNVDHLDDTNCSYLCPEKFTHPMWNGIVLLEL